MTAHENLDGVAIVGGGYAGMHAARALRRSGVRATVFDPAGRHGFVTRLAAVAGGTAPARDASASLGDLVDRVDGRRVVQVGDASLVLDDGASVRADAVVVTAGGIAADAPVPGLERATSLRTPADALILRSAIESAERLVVAGGGPTGVQLAGAATTARPDLEVHLADRSERLLERFSPALGDHASSILSGRGVRLHLETEVVEVTENGVRLDDGTHLEGLVVWAGGFEAATSQFGDSLPLREGRIEVDDHLRAVGFERTFAAGDVAAHPMPDGGVQPMSAQIAVQAGEAAGANAALVARGQPTRPRPLRHRGWVLDLGGGRGVAEVGPVRLAAPVVDRLAPLLHLAIDVKHLLEIAGLDGLRWLPAGPAVLRLVAERFTPAMPDPTPLRFA